MCLCGIHVDPTYSETVLLGKKLGCSVSIKSTSSHTTLTRTCCLLSSLDLSAEQWQLSTIRSGQFLWLTLDSHSPTRSHSQIGALMLDWDSPKHALLSGHILPRLGTSKYSVRSSPHLMPRWSPAARPTSALWDCFRDSTWNKFHWWMWRAVSLSFFVMKAHLNCFLRCGASGKLPAARFPSPDKLSCGASSSNCGANKTCVVEFFCFYKEKKSVYQA